MSLLALGRVNTVVRKAHDILCLPKGFQQLAYGGLSNYLGPAHCSRRCLRQYTVVDAAEGTFRYIVALYLK